MSRKSVKWPQLLIDGGWRWQKLRTGNWPRGRYYRLVKGVRQTVMLLDGNWALFRGSSLVCLGGLDVCLTEADL